MHKQKFGIVLITIFLSLFFLVMAIGYTISYSPGVFPDEFAHMAYIIDVMNKGFPDYASGIIFSSFKLNYLNHPALYYLIVGKLVSFFHFQYMYADVGRYLNILISIFIIILTCKMLFSTTQSVMATFIGGAFLITIPMFVVSGSAVSNDQINVFGCTLVVYGLLKLMDDHKENKILTSSIISICFGGVIASLSKATGSLAIVCLLTSVAFFNFLTIVKIVKKVTLIQWMIILSSLAIVIIYFTYIYGAYGKFYPAPQSNPAIWFAIDNPGAKIFDLSEFVVKFFQANFVTLTVPYGHAPIADIEIRVVILKLILVIISGMTCFVIIKRMSCNDIHYKILFSFVVAYVFFIIIYLYTIRQLHVDTGYMGAMQARYFFGFLPVYSLVIAKVITAINSKVSRLIVFVIIMSGLVASLYPALIRLSDFHTLKALTVVEQPQYNINYGDLTKGRKFEQVIIAESNSIRGVELMLATFARRNHGVLALDLSNQTGQVIYRSTVRLDSLRDNAYAWFDFHHTPLIRNGKYILSLRCDECTNINTITWWAAKKEYEPPVFLFTRFGPGAVSLYPKGNAYVDGKDVGGAFAFRLYF
ncbi:hypothetical protein [Buttiauxella sp.]|uniref:hypothetical protein n=1 Tax=Buttiauxella sp. TaxID=1972222 RepID=UPI003C7709D5